MHDMYVASSSSPIEPISGKTVHGAHYRTAQNFDGENIDEFDEFPAICQYFPYQNFPFS